jgi:squalene monooxygenase
MPHAAEFDIVIGGGGVAGAATAAALHQLGYSILLIEPGLHDDRRLAGEVFHPPGVIGLADLGLLDPLMRATAARIMGFAVTGASAGEYVRLPYDEAHMHRTFGLGIEHGLIRQRLLDAVGGLPRVTVMVGKRVVAVDQSQRPGVLVEVTNGGKTTDQYRCRMLVAADGVQSRLGRSVGIGARGRRISTMFGYRLSAEHLPEPGYGHVILGAAAPILVYPISAHEARILFDVPHGSGRPPRPEDCAEAFAILPPGLRREVAQAVVTQPRMSVAAQASHSDRTVQDRVVLVGDAAGSCHPLTASGMTRCISDALVLRDALAEHPADWPQALRLYERRRRWPQATRLMLADALRDAFCGPTPEARIVQRGILVHWRASSAGRAATIALLSTADGRPLALLREVVRVMARGFLAHLRAPIPPDDRGVIFAGRILTGLVATALGRVKQLLGVVPVLALLRRSWRRLSVYSRDDSIRHFFAIEVPVRAVAHRTHAVVTPLAVNQQDDEIAEVEIRQRAAEQTREAPGQTHQQIAKIVHVPCHAPPSRGEKK